MNIRKPSNKPIGVFDSGLGGLTVLKYLLRYYPGEDFIYLGDLAHLPYGNKSKDNIVNYSLRCSQFLQTKNVKAIIIACNTASSYAHDILRDNFDIPIFDVVNPCAQAVATSNSKKVAVLGTEKTIESNIYFNSIHKINSNITIYNKACPLFVPIVEEGLESTPIAHSIIDYYLRDIKQKKIETLILGCTHYPILIQDLKNYFGKNVAILHSGPIISKILSSNLKITFNKNHTQTVSYYVTDLPYRFEKYGNKFLNKTIPTPQLITI